MNSDEIVALIGALPIRSNKAAVTKAPMKLSQEQTAALGTQKRNILRYVKIAINAISNKLEVEKVEAADTQVTVALNEWLVDTQFDTLQRDIYKAMVRDGITYVLVAFDSENSAPILTQVDSYDGNTGAYTVRDGITNKAVFTVNLWNRGIQRNLDVYYADKIEKYAYNLDTGDWEPRYDYKGEKFPIEWTDDNNAPLGIALVSFDIRESDITDAIQLQQDLNEAHLDMLATSRTMGWPQRVLNNASAETFLLNQFEQPLFTDSAGYPIPRKIELTPGSILMLQGKDSDLTQLPAAETNTTTIDKIEALISKFTDVPNHYFTGEWPSGVALMNSEMRLNHKVESHQGYITPAMVTMLIMMMRLSNTFGDTTLDINTDVMVTWYPPQVEDEELRMEKEKNRVSNATAMFHAGFLSVEDALRYSFPDKDDAEIAAMVNRAHAGNQIVGLGASLA